MSRTVYKAAPTIIDVARRVQLANTTVAEILRGKPGYNEATRRRVLATAKRMGYRPNYLSKALAGSQSKSIGVLAALTETSAVANMVRDIELASRRNNYLCYLLDYGSEDEHQLASHVQNLLDRRVDALIVYQLTDPPPFVERLLRDCGVPVVRFGMVHSNVPHAVRIDRDAAARQLAEHLAELGHREAALIASSYTHRYPDQKMKPLAQAMARVGVKLDCSQRWIIEPGRDYDYGCYELVLREVRRGDLPTTLIFNSDRYAVEAYAALQDAGLSVPRDVSVVGFDDDHYASVLRPALTTIRQPRGEVGQAAFAMLLQLVNEPDTPVKMRDFACKLIVRESTGPARSPG